MYYYLPHAPISFFFKHSPRDFVVEELPLYPFSGEGEHLILTVRKKSLATWEMISKIANYLGINSREIGYAGLKDKHAMTTQHISVHRRFESKIDAMDIEGIKILAKTYHNNKIKLGHLIGNRFFIRLKKVSSADGSKIKHVMQDIARLGLPNYFGFQRFGNDGENFRLGEAICAGTKREKNINLQRMYINAYQSKLFNDWLDVRFANASTNPYAAQIPLGLYAGDIAMHYPHGKAFVVEDVPAELERLESHNTVLSGLLAGKRAMRAQGEALAMEAMFDKPTPVDGERRFAWIYPTEIEAHYKSDDAWMELHFSLPKGCYATVLLEQLAKTPIEKLSEGIDA
ncbi:MAG: pseudouridine synthase [Sulfuricurvum sp. PC08-66]|nr:MAG: pseudouridine synthase [Sulfuricurvum sp. PC08-66]